MDNNNKIILHLVHDGILFDGVSNRFDQMKGYQNIYLFNTHGDFNFTYIKNTEKVIIAKDEEEWGRIISNPNIDIVYIHGLWEKSTRAVRYITNHAIVIWWCYGLEIYENELGIAPLMHKKIYKPKTFWLWQKRNIHIHRFISNFLSYFCPKLYNLIKWIKSPIRQKDIYKMLERVDYLFTPLPLEYDELKRRNKFIKARPFRLSTESFPEKFPKQHIKTGDILLDHSAHLSNNHPDIFRALKQANLNNRTLYIPISYGDNYMKQMIKKFDRFNGSNTIFLERPIPYKDYQEMIQKCSHAFFGGIRQTGLGNIYLCLKNGVKIFMFKDSITFKWLQQKGFYVFSIEEDLTDMEIITPLKPKHSLHNFNLFFDIFGVSHGTYEQQFDRLFQVTKNNA